MSLAPPNNSRLCSAPLIRTTQHPHPTTCSCICTVRSTPIVRRTRQRPSPAASFRTEARNGEDGIGCSVSSTSSPSLPATAAAIFRKIPLSDVEVTRRTRVFWGRKWSSRDAVTGSIILLMHILCLFAPFTFNWPAFWMAIVLYVATGLFGITLSYHRNLSHRSFKLPKWLEYSFAYCGVQALQGTPMDWVSTHRFHHQYCDSERDPHSPTRGFWFSHISWLLMPIPLSKDAVNRAMWAT